MTLDRTRLAPRRGYAHDRVAPAALLAVLLAVLGVAASVWRPLAPATGPVVTDLDRFAPAVLDAVAAYRGPRYLAGALRLAVSVAVPLLVVWTPIGRRLVRRLAGPREHAAGRAWLVAAVITALTSLFTAPLDVWTGYVQDGRWGFRTASLSLWARDRALEALLGAVLAGLAAAVVVWAVRRWPRSWHHRLVLIGTAAVAVLVMVFPLVVEPLFSTTVPLGEGPVRTEVEAVLDRAGEPGLPIVVSDASTRSTKVNAYVSGLGPTRQVVLYDTILELPPDQVGVVVAHELAHREHRDLARTTLLTAAGLLVSLWLLRIVWTSYAAADRVDARGPSDPRLVAVGLAFVAVANLVGQPVTNAVSRRAEAAADHRAVELTGEADLLVRTARTFTVRDLSPPDPPAWVVVLWGTHPTVGERIRAAVAQAQRAGDPLPTLEELRDAERDVRHPAIVRREAG